MDRAAGSDVRSVAGWGGPGRGGGASSGAGMSSVCGAPGPGRRGCGGAGPGGTQLAIGEFVSSPQKARVPIAPIAEISTRLMIIDLAVARPTPTGPPVAL